MTLNIQDISTIVGTFRDVLVLEDFHKVDHMIAGKISLTVEGTTIYFDVQILQPYPMKFHDLETIRFINSDMIQYDHVNEDGSICVQTLHSTDLATKLAYDFESLRYWMRKYYIHGEQDNAYEHIVVPDALIDGYNVAFLFTEVDHSFAKGEFGEFKYSFLSLGRSDKFQIKTFIIQSFLKGKEHKCCHWSSTYKRMDQSLGIYYFLEVAPAKNKRFAIKSWVELEPYISQNFLDFLYKYQQKLKSDHQEHIYLLLGYRLSENEIHWQAIWIETKNFPNYGQKILGLNRYIGRLRDQKIHWCATRNCSYRYFFGRGALNQKLTQSKILIVGIGAIGSMVARCFVKGGAVDIGLVDYDLKEPENVCRSEYSFITGITSKVVELEAELIMISPFVEVKSSEQLFDSAKLLINQEGAKEALEGFLSKFDLIIDCSTDNDLTHILDGLALAGQVLCFSVTNHAKEFVCATKPEMYKWLTNMFQKLSDDNVDLYKPTGCWNPTFKASYTDIALLTQFAIKHINSMFQSDLPIRNFYLSTSEDDVFNIKLRQF